MKWAARRLGIVLLIGLASGGARADQPLPLFRPGLVDPLKVLPAPAAIDTEEMRQELQTVLRVQETRTQKGAAEARADEKVSLASFQCVLGPWLTADNLPRLDAVLRRAEKEARAFSGPAKRHFQRPRPATVDSRVKPLLEKTDAGYPSSHAVRGQLFAVLLADLARDKADALLARGRAIGWSRVVCGVHFPSDVIAGRTLGQALAVEMLANPTFRQEWTEVRKEFQAARRRQGAAPASGGR
jgi:acid phosphatase (class A)